MNWQKLDNVSLLEEIKNESTKQPVAIFKHSTRCSISATALDRFERNWAKVADHKNLKMYYLDLIAHRDISNKIASDFGVQHESPQILVIKDGEVIYDESHYGIDLGEVLDRLN